MATTTLPTRTYKQIQHNEELRAKHPSFHSTGNNRIVFLHCLTSMSTIEELLKEAEKTTTYTIDTESHMINNQACGAIVQIQMVKSSEQSITIITEMFYLPRKNSLLFKRIKQLYSIIFNNENRIISWGEYKNEFKDFLEYELIDTNGNIEAINLQKEFQEWHNNRAGKKITHPAEESRGIVNGHHIKVGDGNERERQVTGQCDCGHSSHVNPGNTWSLQDAIAQTTREFLDKTERRGKWSCGLDPELGRWRSRTFGIQYNQTKELNKRQSMLNYAINDCLATTKLFVKIFPHMMTGLYIDTSLPTATILKSSHEKTIPQSTISPRTTEQLKQWTTESRPTYQHRTELQTLEFTSEEIERQKAKQRWKNTKYKWKKQNLPSFKNELSRAVYFKYQYQHVKAQLKDDGYYQAHDIKINKETNIVTINFESKELLQEAQQRMPSNYFSSIQYHERWG